MDFSVSSLLAGFIFSVIGWWLFREGKKQSNIPVVVIGILLMVYTLFTPTPLTTWGTGIGLCFLAHHFWNQ